MLPKLRTSPARKRKRRSHHALNSTNLAVCPNCGSNRLPHRSCPSCGYVRPGLHSKNHKSVALNANRCRCDGGDLAPDPILEGALMATSHLESDDVVVLYGDEKVIQEGIKNSYFRSSQS